MSKQKEHSNFLALASNPMVTIPIPRKTAPQRLTLGTEALR